MGGTYRAWLAVLGLLALAASFAALGFWQWQRADGARARIERHAAASEQPALTAPPEDGAQRYRLLEVQGRYEPQVQLLLDNRVHDGHAGYEVLTAFRVAGVERTLIVNRGWIRADPDRRVLPDVAVAASARALRGRIDLLPRPGIALSGPAQEPRAGVLVVSYPSAAAVAEYFGMPTFDYQVLLDAGEPDGYLRDWRIEGLTPARHRAYAGQWLLLAGGAAAVALVIGATQLASRRRQVMRRRLTPWLIALVCVGPFGLAALLYYGPWDLGGLPQLPGSRELVAPPVKLPPLAARRARRLARGGRRSVPMVPDLCKNDGLRRAVPSASRPPPPSPPGSRFGGSPRAEILRARGRCSPARRR